MIESTLRKKIKVLDKRIEERLQTISHEEKDEILGWYDGDLYQLSKLFPQIQRYSLMTTIISRVETDLLMVCGEMTRIFDRINNYKSPERDVIGKAYRYLKNELKIDVRPVAPYYENILTFRKIRNCIVHSEGLAVYLKEKNDQR